MAATWLSVPPLRILWRMHHQGARSICATLALGPPVPASPRRSLSLSIRTEPSWEQKAFCLPSVLQAALSRFWPSLRAIPQIRFLPRLNPLRGAATAAIVKSSSVIPVLAHRTAPRRQPVFRSSPVTAHHPPQIPLDRLSAAMPVTSPSPEETPLPSLHARLPSMIASSWPSRNSSIKLCGFIGPRTLAVTTHQSAVLDFS